MRRPTGRNTGTCRLSPPTTAAMPTGFTWSWSNRNSKLTRNSRQGLRPKGASRNGEQRMGTMAEYVVEFGKDGRPVEQDGRLDAAAFHRNHQPIWAVLEKFLGSKTGDVLE